MRIRKTYGLAVGLFSGCLFSESSPPLPPETDGTVMIQDTTEEAFSIPIPNLDSAALALHRAGDATFKTTFLTDNAALHLGLGPVFNNTSCAACHTRNGGIPPSTNPLSTSSLLFRISLAGQDETGGPIPVPGYGTQIQQCAIFNVQPEAQVSVTYRDSTLEFTDGSVASLRIPIYTLEHGYLPFPNGILLSPRVAQPVFGLGLLEAVDEKAILSHADPDDQDHDGISGRANYVWDMQVGRAALGRFGWKANVPTLFQQTAMAFNSDMGVTTTLFPEETCYGQSQGCEGSSPELDSGTVAAVAFYLATLAVPARRNSEDAQVRLGETEFRSLGCAACHLPDLRTGHDGASAALRDQPIHAYTDLLVHDMGEGLADNRPDFQAGEREWRTTPLWGIGLRATVNRHTLFLHDSRARNLTEAILWHGGESEQAKAGFLAGSAEERQALLAFLNSL